MDVEPPVARAVEDHPPMTAAELVERHVERDVRAARKRFEHRGEHPVVGLRPQGHRALGKRELRIAQQSGGVRARLGSQSLAGRAPSQRAVEREVVRRERLEAPPATVADEMLAVRFGRPLRLG